MLVPCLCHFHCHQNLFVLVSWPFVVVAVGVVAAVVMTKKLKISKVEITLNLQCLIL